MKLEICLKAVLLLALLLAACRSREEKSVEVYTVRRGEFTSSLTVSGELDAVDSRVISVPSLSWSMGMPKISKIVDDGKQVEKGELLVQFDPAEVQKTISDARNELEIATAELAKTRLNQASDLADLEADLEIAGLGYSISKLNLEQAAYKAEIDRKKIELDLEKARINMEQARQDIESRKKVQAEELSKLELQVQQARKKLEQAEQTLSALTVLAPSPGIAIVRESWITGEKYQVNDQVYSGWPLIGLPDLSAIKAKVLVNEVDIAKIDSGQNALVRLDAFPDTAFAGRVTEITILARNKERDSKVKVFDATILLEGSDARLIPGMTVKCEVIVDRVRDTLFIPLIALFHKNGENVVYVRKGSGFESRQVNPGLESDNYVIIDKGLEAGERVALVDPTLQPETPAGKEAGKEPAAKKAEAR